MSHNNYQSKPKRTYNQENSSYQSNSYEGNSSYQQRPQHGGYDRPQGYD